MTPAQKSAMQTEFTTLRMVSRDAVGDGQRKAILEALRKLKNELLPVLPQEYCVPFAYYDPVDGCVIADPLFEADDVKARLIPLVLSYEQPQSNESGDQT